MLYLVEAHPTIENGNTIDAGEGPGNVIAQIVERFPSPGDLRESDAPPNLYGHEPGHTGQDGGANVCPHLVYQQRSDPSRQ
jgi:hypothetical protein